MQSTFNDWNDRSCMKVPSGYTEEDLKELIISLCKYENKYFEEIFTTNKTNLLYGYRTIAQFDEPGQIRVYSTHNSKPKVWALIEDTLLEEDSLYMHQGGNVHISVFIYFNDRFFHELDSKNVKNNIILKSDIEIKSVDENNHSNSFDIKNYSEYIECDVSKDGRYSASIIKKMDIELDIYKYEIQVKDLILSRDKSIWSSEYLEPHTLRFSPNNKFLLFSCVSRDGYWDDLIVLNLANFKQHILKSGFQNISNLCWKDDSRIIFFVCDDDEDDKLDQSVYIKHELIDKVGIKKNKVIGQITFSELEYNDGELIKKLTTKKQCIDYLCYCGKNRSLLYIEDRKDVFLESVNYLVRLNLDTYQYEEIVLPSVLVKGLSVSPFNEDTIAFFGARERPQLTMEGDYGYGINIYDLRLHVLDFKRKKFFQLEDEGLAAGVPFGTSVINSELYWESAHVIRYIVTKNNTTAIAVSNYKDSKKNKVLTIGNGNSKCHCFDHYGNCYMFYSEEGSDYKFSILNLQDNLMRTYPRNLHSIENGFECLDIKQGYSWLLVPTIRKNKKISLIVNIYGGTSPLTKAFDPLHQMLLSKGFAVLIINTVGSSGYGTKFADAHLDDWGINVVKEIKLHIYGALDSYRFLNSKSIGIYGGSYGGFITNLLLAETSIFKAGCSVSGISSIPSYIGSSDVAFLYSYTSLNKYSPWSKEIIDQSPLFKSTKIEAPLLLIHGLEDKNVSVNESEQLFTFLKLQKKDVSLYTFRDEGHNLRKKPTTFIEVNKLITSWFNQKLKYS